MTIQMQNAINQIFENKDLSKKLIKLETLDEIFEFFKNIDNTISKEDFEEAINEVLEKSSEKLTDETLSKVSGGTLNKTFKKSLATTLAALSVGSSQIYAAPQTRNKTVKVISTALLTALGITGATALGATLYYILNKSGDLTETDQKNTYYTILTDSSNSARLKQASQALIQLIQNDENFKQDFNNALKAKNIKFENLNPEIIENLLKDQDFFNSLPLSVIQKILPKEIKDSVEQIISSRKESQSSSPESFEPATSTQKTSSFIKGLPNSTGSSCHLNSVLQLLRQIPEIRQGNLKPEGKADNKTIEKINSLNEVMKAINNSKDVADENFEKEKEKLLKLLYNDGWNSTQDASEDLFGLNLPFESLGIKSLLSFNSETGFVAKIKDIDSNPDDVGGDQSENSKYKLFIVNTRNKKNFEEFYELNGKKYELKSVVCYPGGHYYTYSKGENNKWYMCDDDKIKTATFDNIKKYSSYPTMFLYSRVDKTPKSKLKLLFNKLFNACG